MHTGDDNEMTPREEEPMNTLHSAILVGLGGAVGTIIRYLVSAAIPHAAGLDLGTLLVNLSGAFVLGWLTSVLAVRGADADRSARTRLFVGTGVLGGYTTYSTLAIGSLDAIAAGSVAAGIAYALGSVVLGIACAAAGILLGRRPRAAAGEQR